ncbi:Condensin-2 complex subunit D3 [Lamellibrachia satsuma]|nr:Condensin-2 complex subunit D3 [Lamellibrachia satsuma]
MADVQATVDIISALKIRELDSEWVSAIWNTDFTEVDPLPEDVAEDISDSDQYIQTLRKVLYVLTSWANGKEGPTGEGFWTVMMENELSHRSLIALLYYIMETAQRRLASAAQKEAGIVAAAVYFSIIKIPGSGAFHVFHPMLFQKAVDSFKLLIFLGCPKRKRTSSLSSSQGRSKAKRRGRSAANRNDSPFGESDDDEEEEDEGMSRQEIVRLHADTFRLLKSFVELLGECHLKESNDTTIYCLQMLVRLTRLDAETFDGNFSDTRPVAEMRRIPEVAYKGLNMLCTPSHGDVNTTYTAMCKHLLPSLLMLIGDNKGVAAQTIPRPVQHIKDHAVAYIVHLLQTESADCLHSVRILLQHLCVKVPDKADYRSKVAQVFVDILNEHATAAYASIIQWLHRYSRNAKMSYRVFALDIVTLLLNLPERLPDDTVLPEHIKFLSHHFLIQMIVARCSDVASTVRSRAIAGFVECVSSDQPIIINAIKEIVTPRPVVRAGVIPRLVPTPGAHVEADGGDQKLQSESTESNDTMVGPETRRNTSDTGSPLAPVPLQTPGPNTPISLPDNKGVVSMLRRRVCDEKVNVRKAAVQALESLILLDAANFCNQDLDAIYQRCHDPALSVRKQALVSLTTLLQEMPYNVQLQRIWLDGVLPMVMDRETGAQEKCLSVLEDVLLVNILPVGRSEDTDGCRLTWSLLDLIAGNDGADLRRYLRKAFQQWMRAGKLKPKLIDAIQSHTDSRHNNSAWMLLSEMGPFASHFNVRLVLNYWQQHAQLATEMEYETIHRVLTVLGHVAKNIDKPTLLQLADDLKKRLMKFDAPPELIAVTVLTLNKVCRAHTNESGVSRRVRDEWFGELLMQCDTYLSQMILCENPVAPLDEEQVVRHLFTLGEIAQLCPERTPKRAFMLVQSLIATPTITDGGSQSSQPDSLQSSQSSQGGFSQGIFSQFKGSQMSGKIRAHAFLALGKLCLQNEDLAKKCVPAMARELETSTDLCVRNNVLVILCDLCVRYTLVVDSYVSNITACLKDESALVRKHCLTVLTRLLQEDFLKWKGSLFFRFITALVDENDDIKNFADFCLMHLLKQRHPGMFFHHFIECIFHFSSYEGHLVYNKFSQTEREKKLFSLKGQANREKRLHIYKVLLENMTDEQKFQLTGKLCSEVLAAVVDEVIPLDADTSTILQDTLSILSSKEIRLSSMQSKAQNDDIADEQDMAATVLNAAKKTIISKVLKVNLIENIVPTVMSLKHILESRHSPVLKDLMLYLRDLMKEHKNEIKDILVSNKQLAAEIEFDLRKFEEEQQRQEQPREVVRRSSIAMNSSVSSPRVLSSPRVPGSPRVPVPSTPAQGKTPQRVSVGRGLNNQPSTPALGRVIATATPARVTPMATVAIMNSARKAMEKARRLSTGQTTKSPAPSTRRVQWERENIPPQQTPKQNGRTRSQRRAISTPAHVAMANITFQQGDQNMSVIPPSPIPTSLPIRLYSEGASSSSEAFTSCRTVSLDTDDAEDGAERTPVDIICMLSPDRPTPKPRTWNIKSAKTLDKTGSSKKVDDSRASLGTRRSGRIRSQTTEQGGK